MKESETFDQMQKCRLCLRSMVFKGTPHVEKKCFLSGIAQIPPPLPLPPISGKLNNFFGRHKGIYKVYFLIFFGGHFSVSCSEVAM